MKKKKPKKPKVFFFPDEKYVITTPDRIVKFDSLVKLPVIKKPVF